MKYITYPLAAFMTIAMLLIFINMGQWMQMMVQLPFMKVDPWIAGGEVVDSVITDSSRIYIHEAAHPGLFTNDESNEMVQYDIYGVVSDSLLMSVAGSKPDDVIKSCKTSDHQIIRFYRKR
ncbi:MAG: hypothetical protein MJZ15_01455 [Bacteroidales bacterium]|nr:hypothetical protein [Bacteroidales bacterium]